MREKKRREGTRDPGRTLDKVVAEQEQEYEEDEAAVRETPHLLQTSTTYRLTAECRVHSADRLQTDCMRGADVSMLARMLCFVPAPLSSVSTSRRCILSYWFPFLPHCCEKDGVTPP